jgi:hypothetical protein
LKDSRNSSFGFCAVVLDGGQSGQPQGTKASQHQTRRAHITARCHGRRQQHREQTYRLRNIAKGLEGAAQSSLGASRDVRSKVGVKGRLDEVVMRRSSYPQRVKPESSHRALVDRAATGLPDMGCKRRVASERSVQAQQWGRGLARLKRCNLRGLRRRLRLQLLL